MDSVLEWGGVGLFIGEENLLLCPGGQSPSPLSPYPSPERAGRPRPAADSRDRARGGGAELAQDQQRPVRLFHSHHYPASQVSAGTGTPSRGPGTLG